MSRYNYKNIKVWQKGIALAKMIRDILDDFPTEEKYGLTSQMSRCSISIPSNIAEGSSRTTKSFKHFIDISLGSSFELGSQLIIAKHKNYITSEQLEDLEKNNEEF